MLHGLLSPDSARQEPTDLPPCRPTTSLPGLPQDCLVSLAVPLGTPLVGHTLAPHAVLLFSTASDAHWLLSKYF